MWSSTRTNVFLEYLYHVSATFGGRIQKVTPKLKFGMGVWLVMSAQPTQPQPLKQVENAEVWHPDVEQYEVYDAKSEAFMGCVSPVSCP